MPGLRIAIDLHGIEAVEPRGPARYARCLVDALCAIETDPQLAVWEPGAEPGPADVIVALGGRPRINRRTPVVAAVYDLSHLLAPSTMPLAERVRRGFDVAWVTRRAAHLLAPSRGISVALATYLRVPESRLTWLPSVGPAWRRAPRPEVEAARSEAGLDRPYLLFAGTLSRRKNLPVLAAAWERVRTELGGGLDLVVCGAGPGSIVPRGARYLGYVSDDRLKALLSGATAWVSPSRAEGSAIGALEAMACAAPPLVASGTALAEVVGTAGIVLDPDDVEGWATAIRTLATQSHDRNRMAARGLQAVRDLRLAESAARVLRAAESAVAAGGR
jgi:glycosyltransferase involved in cell wall biosynthesis